MAKGKIVRYFLAFVVASCAPSLMAQFGGREGDVVLYSVSAKGNPNLEVVSATTVNTATGFEKRDPNALTFKPFGPDFPGEFFVDLHNETGDNFRYVQQKEGIETQHNRFRGPGKVMISQGIDRLIIPNKEPIDLTAGLFAPFPEGVDFGPEVPILEARSFVWSPSPFFPLIEPMDPSFRGPQVPPGDTGNEFVLDLGKFLGILPWVGMEKIYPGVGWPFGIDQKLIERDDTLGTTARLFRLRGGRKTPTFVIRANTHLAVLSGSVQIIPPNGTPVTLTRHQYAFIPSGFAIVLSNPKQYTGPTAEDPQ
jgi:hypothetical protein